MCAYSICSDINSTTSFWSLPDLTEMVILHCILCIIAKHCSQSGAGPKKFWDWSDPAMDQPGREMN